MKQLRRSGEVRKEAKLETGLEISIPLFIAQGDVARVDPAIRKYAGEVD